MAEDAIRDDYEDKYLGGGEDDVTERLAEIDDETADQRAQALLEGLEDYDLDEEDRALLGAWGFDIEEGRAAGRPGGGDCGSPERG